jgi:hypothetical protein
MPNRKGVFMPFDRHAFHQAVQADMRQRVPALTAFFEAVQTGNEDAIVLDWEPMTRADDMPCWQVTVSDSNAARLRKRYLDYASRSGLKIFSLVSHPLKTGGVSIALIIGIPKKEVRHV